MMQDEFNRQWLLALLLLPFLRTVQSGASFRFGAVLSTNGSTSEIADAKRGYELFFNRLNNLADQKGFYVHGKNNTGGFHFSFDYIWKEDNSDSNQHREMVYALLDDEKVHFLGGSHNAYADIETRLAFNRDRINYQCCADADVHYERHYPTTFGIFTSSRGYAQPLVRRLSLVGVKRLMFVMDIEDTSARTTCEDAIGLARNLGLVDPSEEDAVTRLRAGKIGPRFFDDTVTAGIRYGVEAVIACVRPTEGKRLVDAFHDREYPLKSFFLTAGPANMEWVNSFEPKWRANDLLSAAQWHHDLHYSDDFFGSGLEYVEAFESKFEGRHPTDIAAGASAVGLSLVEAIISAFRDCDISRTNGDVEALLFDPESIFCDDELSKNGYERVLLSLHQQNMETFFGHVKFDQFGRNRGLTPITTQVFEVTRTSGEVTQELKAVLPDGFTTDLMHFPAVNRYTGACPPGSFVSTDSFNPCVLCPPGEISESEDSPRCDRCPAGWWNDIPGQSRCVRCPEGTTTIERGATREEECVCRPGYFQISSFGGDACASCPKGATCNGGAEPPIPMEGYWASSSSRGEIYPCESTSNCVGGENLECASGYSGRLCASCDEGYFSVIQRCHRCKSTPVIVTLYVLLLVGWYIINVIVSDSVSSLDMILSWAQLANIIGDVELNWTEMVETMFGVANILDFDVDILEPTCFMNWGFRENFITQLCIPFVMTSMSGFGYVGSATLYTLQKRKWIHLDGRQRRIVSLFFLVPQSDAQLKEKLDTTIATFLASVEITYVTIAKYCSDVFKCQTIAGVSVLRVDPSVECDANHVALMTLAALGIVFYVVGFPAFVLWKLADLQDRAAFAEPQNLRRYGFLYKKYELSYFYTPAITLVRKLLFVLVLVYMNNPAFQVGAIAIIINASLMIHVYTAPYIDTYLDVLFNFLLLALMFESFGGLMFYSENLPAADRKILEWIIMTTLFILVAVFLVIFVIELRTKYRVAFIRRLHREYGRKGVVTRPKSFLSWSSAKAAIQRAVSRTPSESGPDAMKVSFELLDTFDPAFVYQSLYQRPELIEDWNTLTDILQFYVSDQSDTSYLSLDPVAKFWRKLVDRFPELVDFLAVTDDTTREHFASFARNLYRNFYLMNKVDPLPLMKILNWRDHAPMAQWLATVSKRERVFFINLMAKLFRASGKGKVAEALETKFRSGVGPVPETVGRDVRNRKIGRILLDLSNGSDPLRNSAATERRETLGKAPINLDALSEEASASRPPPSGKSQGGCSKSASGGQFSRQDRTASRSDAQNKPAASLQDSSSTKKTASFGVEVV